MIPRTSIKLIRPIVTLRFASTAVSATLLVSFESSELLMEDSHRRAERFRAAAIAVPVMSAGYFSIRPQVNLSYAIPLSVEPVWSYFGG